MQMIYCPNCGKRAGFKRTLGFGTVLMVLVTCGLWLLVIPFYPVRCMNCGMKRSSAVMQNILAWYRGLNRGSRAYVILVPLVILACCGVFNAILSAPQPNVDNSSTPPTAASNNPSSVPTGAKHDLRSVPNTVGGGGVSDGRTYSVSLIDENKNNIPTGTDLFVRGAMYTVRWGPTDDCSWLLAGRTTRVQHGEADPRSYCYFSILLDEKSQDGSDRWPASSLVCKMSPEELREVTHLYHYGDEVQVHGVYGDSLDFNVASAGMAGGGHFGVPVLENCTVMRPTGKVVGPDR
jgi:hypothetical protein